MSNPPPPPHFGPEQAAGYDQRFAKIHALRDALHLLMAAVLGRLPSDARILCVGAGTGLEVQYLALRFPGWNFTVVEPSAPMLEICRRRAEAEGFGARCTFHEGYLPSLPTTEPHQAATSLLVSHFILEPAARVQYFAEIAARLAPEGVLVNADLAGERGSPEYAENMEVWGEVMRVADVTPEKFAEMCRAYAEDVALLPGEEVRAIIARGGFTPPTQFLQTAMIHAWFARRLA